jgi:hypothetical protein
MPSSIVSWQGMINSESGEPVTLVQSAQGASWNSDAAFNSDTTPGNYVIACVTWASSSATDLTFTVADSQGLSYSLDASTRQVNDNGGSNFDEVGVQCAHSTTATTAAADTVSVTMSGSSGATVAIWEVNPSSGALTLDQASTASGMGPTVSAGSITPSQAGTFAVAAVSQQDGLGSQSVFGAGTGWTLLGNTGGGSWDQGTEYQTLTAASPVTGTFTSSTAANGYAVIVANYKSGGSSGTLSGPTFSPYTPYSGAATTVTISGPSGAAILYCTDNTNSCTPSTAYSAPISVTFSSYIRAQATEGGYTSSSVTSWQGTITGPTGSSVTLVQTTQGASWNSDASFGTNTAAGDYVIACVTWASSSTSGLTFTVADSQGLSYSVDAPTRQVNDNGGSNFAEVGVQCAHSTTTTAAAADTVSVTMSGQSGASVAIWEVSSSSGTLALDQANTATGTGTTVNAGSITPSQAGTFAVSAVSQQDGLGSQNVFGASTGWTFLGNTGGGSWDQGTEYQYLPTVSPVSGTFASNAGANGYAALVANYASH